MHSLCTYTHVPLHVLRAYTLMYRYTANNCPTPTPPLSILPLVHICIYAASPELNEAISTALQGSLRYIKVCIEKKGDKGQLMTLNLKLAGQFHSLP